MFITRTAGPLMCVWSIFNNFTMDSFLPHTDFTQFLGSTDTPSVVIVYVVWDLCLSAHFHPEKNTNQVLLEKMRKAPCVGEHTQTRGSRWRRMIWSGLMERFVCESKITHFFYHNMPALHRFNIHKLYIKIKICLSSKWQQTENRQVDALCM